MAHRERKNWKCRPPAKSQRAAPRHHPIYAGRLSKEHPLLQHLIVGDLAMAAYLATLKSELKHEEIERGEN